MIPIIIKNNRILNIMEKIFVMNLNAITLWPFIIIKENNLPREIINHELIHIAQCKELLVVGFYILFILEFIFNTIKYRDRYKAYCSSLFEIEAYTHMSDLSYLKKRRYFAWISERNIKL